MEKPITPTEDPQAAEIMADIIDTMVLCYQGLQDRAAYEASETGRAVIALRNGRKFYVNLTEEIS